MIEVRFGYLLAPGLLFLKGCKTSIVRLQQQKNELATVHPVSKMHETEFVWRSGVRFDFSRALATLVAIFVCALLFFLGFHSISCFLCITFLATTRAQICDLASMQLFVNLCAKANTMTMIMQQYMLWF